MEQDVFVVSGVSSSGLESENIPEFPITGLTAARAHAHFLLAQADMFTAWVQGNGVNECHRGRCGVPGCPEHWYGSCDRCGMELAAYGCPACE